MSSVWLSCRTLLHLIMSEPADASRKSDQIDGGQRPFHLSIDFLPRYCFLCAWHTAVFTQPSVFLALQSHAGMSTGMKVPAAFPGIRFSSSSLRVMSATALPCGTIAALGSPDP